MREPSPARQAYLSGIRKSRRRVQCLRAALLVGFFLLWELAARVGLIDPFIMSSPSRVGATLWELAVTGELWRHTAASCLETVVGFTLGTALGTLIAVLLWWSDTLARVLDPYLVVLGALPKTALGPIFIVWVGAGPGAIVAMTLAISIVVTILDMYQGFASTDKEKIRLLKAFGADKGQILRKLVFPGSCTTLVSTLKVNVGLSWVGVIMGEFLVSKEGLGYLIVYGSQVFQMDLVMSTVLILAAASALMYRLVLWLERALKSYMGVRA